MQITRSRGFKVNLGNYEHAEFWSSITVGTDDIPDGDDITSIHEVLEWLEDFAEKALDESLRPDLENAAKLTVKEESFLYTEPQPEPAPPRLERTTRPRRRN